MKSIKKKKKNNWNEYCSQNLLASVDVVTELFSSVYFVSLVRHDGVVNNSIHEQSVGQTQIGRIFSSIFIHLYGGLLQN